MKDVCALLDAIAAAPIVPTVYPLAAETLVVLVRALAEEGYPALEILSRPPETAFKVFRELCGLPGGRSVALGLGTILTRSVAEKALALAPDFVVSPAFGKPVLDAAHKAGVPYIPAVLTFQDVQNALEAFEERGIPLRVLKLCPVVSISPAYVEMLAGCYPGIAFCPTGELSPANYAMWRACRPIGAAMSSKFVPPEMLEKGDVAAIRARLRLFREIASAAR